MSDMIRVDLHNHTHYSPDSLTTPSDLIRAAHRARLDRVAVTDHNAVNGALEAFALAPELVIVGEEVMTSKAELLGLFVKEYIPPFLSPLETISRLRQQGAFISVSHPFDPTRSGWSLTDMEELAPLVDAIEVFNAHCFTRQMNDRAAEFAAQYDLPGTAGSDAHWASEIGCGVMSLPPFNNADELRAVIRQGTIQGKSTSSLTRFLSPYIRIRKLFERV